ncbi:MAG: hypothetical protein P8R42_11870 [Candidatus Binatia bacterium]|nr:hypothetical protein [Candidatus Binatia bacterium]
MRDPLDRRLRWLFGSAAAAFGLLGGTLALSLLGVTGNLLGFAPEASPWIPFAIAYAVMAALVAGRIARAPRRQTFLMLALAGALGASGLTALGLWASAGAGPQARVLGSGAAIELASALLCACAWGRLWFADLPGEARERRDEALLQAVLSTLVPEGGAVEIGASESGVRERVLARRSVGRTEVGIRLELRQLDLASRWVARESFTQASPDTRSEVLNRLCGSRVGALRRIALAWRAAALAAYYADARVQGEIGFDRRYLDRRLAEGPNRDAHRARLEAESAGEASDRGVLRQPEVGTPVLRLIRTGGQTSQ